MILGLMTDAEWAFFAPFVTETGPLRGRPPRDHRRTLGGIFWVTRTGAPWRDLPEELGNRNSVHRQFRRLTAGGLWDLMLEALADGGSDNAVPMVDSTIIRAQHCAADARGGLKTRLLAVRAAGFRPKSMPGPTLRVFQSRCC